jgi:hypothetical protein
MKLGNLPKRVSGSGIRSGICQHLELTGAMENYPFLIILCVAFYFVFLEFN